MEKKIGSKTLRLIKGDITTIRADAIVNAANTHLAGGGGVDGAIHEAGGPAIMAECRKIGRCPTGGAVATTAGKLSAKYVIHAVGPVWRGGVAGEDGLLESAYMSSLKLAEEKKLKTVAYPSISTGVYRFPLDRAARIAVKAAVKFLEESEFVREVVFVLYNEGSLAAFEKSLSEINPG